MQTGAAEAGRCYIVPLGSCDRKPLQGRLSLSFSIRLWKSVSALATEVLLLQPMPATTSTSLFYGDRTELGDFISKVKVFNSFRSNILALNPLLKLQLLFFFTSNFQASEWMIIGNQYLITSQCSKYITVFQLYNLLTYLYDIRNFVTALIKCHFIDSSLADVEAVEKLASKKKWKRREEEKRLSSM